MMYPPLASWLDKSMPTLRMWLQHDILNLFTLPRLSGITCGSCMFRPTFFRPSSRMCQKKKKKGLIDGACWRDDKAVQKPGHSSIIIEGIEVLIRSGHSGHSLSLSLTHTQACTHLDAPAPSHGHSQTNICIATLTCLCRDDQTFTHLITDSFARVLCNVECLPLRSFAH